MSPGFFFFLPSPKVLCPEVLAVAMLSVAEVGRSWPLSIYLVVLFWASPQPTVATPSSVDPSGWYPVFLTLRGCLWRCSPLSPGAPWDMRRVRLGGICNGVIHGSGPVPGILWGSVAVSVTAALRMGPAIVSLPIWLTPAAGTTRVISESELTGWCKAAHCTVTPLLNQPHMSS